MLLTRDEIRAKYAELTLQIGQKKKELRELQAACPHAERKLMFRALKDVKQCVDCGMMNVE